MAIKRYYATKDNTITNAYKANLQTRGVSGNMGQSDILEIFHIYAQASTSSSELARVLIEFDTDTINSDRDAGLIPASGSVSFFLKMYDAEHSQTTPKDYTLIVSPISQSWDEGLGLDMEEYSDLGASNWISASSGYPWVGDDSVKATAQIVVIGIVLNTQTATLTDSDGNSTVFTVDNTTPSAGGGGSGGSSIIGISDVSTVSEMANAIATAINNTSDAGYTAGAVVDGVGFSVFNVTQDTAGTRGNKENSSGLTGVTVADFTGGTDIQGGSYRTDSEYLFTQSFDTGFENLEVDVSHLVEDWISGDLDNYGFGVRLTGSDETAEDSYYTKMFFARGSQFFHKRPVIEARWDSSKKDNRGDFYLSSSLVPASDNLMNLYLYNVVRGELTDIPAVGTGDILVSIYSGSTSPTGDKLELPAGGGVVTNGDVNITGSHVETGIYSCSFAYNSSSITTIFDVWHSGGVEYHTGSAISVQTFDSQDYNLDQRYVSKVTNLRAVYDRNEKARFRLYTRQKDWSPTIYTVANNEIETSIIDNTYYRFTRVSDNLEVIPFGTGSLNHTRLSYDTSGSYFDLEMDLFDTDTVYELSFAYLINGSYVEQPERFRFRVE
jgi:hypothetical protein